MNPAMWIAKTGLDAQQTRIGVIANNLANVNTTGFKGGRAVFEDLTYQNVRQPGAQNSDQSVLPSGMMLGTGVRTVATDKSFVQGNLIQTDNALDMAINGRGFFQITRPDGTTGYTRDGSFQVNADGDLVTASGNLVDPGISIPDDALSITVGVDGVVSIVTPGSVAPTTVGDIELAYFINPAGLQPIGENLFLETAASGAPTTGTPGEDGLGTIFQGSLESSNVNVAEELVNMIEAQRAFEASSKAISAVDDMLRFLNQNV